MNFLKALPTLPHSVHRTSFSGSLSIFSKPNPIFRSSSMQQRSIFFPLRYSLVQSSFASFSTQAQATQAAQTTENISTQVPPVAPRFGLKKKKKPLFDEKKATKKILLLAVNDFSQRLKDLIPVKNSPG